MQGWGACSDTHDVVKIALEKCNIFWHYDPGVSPAVW